MKELSKIDKQSGKLSECADFYLIEPILLQIKLIQNDLVEALDKMLPHFVLNVQLQNFAVCLQKAQYDNI